MAVLTASIVALAIMFLLSLLDIPDVKTAIYLLGAVAFYLTLEAFRQ
jgi:hypothetical protein